MTRKLAGSPAVTRARRAVTIGLLVGLAASAAAPNGGRTIPTPPDAVVAQMAPEGPIRSVALVIADRAGWTPVMAALARDLSGQAALVVGIDGAALGRAGSGCADLGRRLTDLGATALRAHAPSAAIAPTLVGIGTGATLAYAAFAQGAGGFKGLLTAGFDRRLPPGARPCATGALRLAAGAVILPRKTPGPWTELLDHAARVPPDRGAAPRPGLARVPWGDGPTPPERRAAVTEAYLRLAGLDAARADQTALTDLPLTVTLPTAAGDDRFAVFLSGDGGWAAFDRDLAAHLAAAGMPVVGISALRYLWQRREPGEIAADIARIVGHYAPAFGRPRVVLIGFSLGANITPFYATQLAPSVRDRVAGLVLLAPETATGFEVQPGGWLGLPTGDTAVAPALAKAGAAFPTLCLFGRDERASPCPLAAGVDAVALPGGHHLNSAHQTIARLILDRTGPAAR